MRLKNKKTGKVIEWFNNTEGIFPNSLTELNEDWEDYNEFEYWYIDNNGDVLFSDLDEEKIWEDLCEERKQIGNYFETKEEAELAVEKLKAWKRLSSLSFKFKGWRTADLGADKYYFVITAESDGAGKGDLDLLFGGEE